MDPRIRTLANQMTALRDKGQTFVLMLGAGASLSSGIPPASKIVADLLDKYGAHIPGTDQAKRFDRLWSSAAPVDREMFLEPYLSREPSLGFRRLAELTRAGFFDRIITFNFDRLIETSFQRAGMQPGEDYLVVVRGDRSDEAVVAAMDRPKPRVKLLKLHGSLTGSEFLFPSTEMLAYPDPIREMLRSLTAGHIIICGYAFEDISVERAFSEKGGPIYCVNPNGRPKRLRAFVTLRQSQNFTIEAESGKFDNFMTELHDALQVEVASPVARLEPSYSPAAYISYAPEDSEFASKLAADLRKAGANVVEDDLERCSHLLPIVSPAYGNSSRAWGDISKALDRRKTIIPVLLPHGEIPFRLIPVNHADFTGDYQLGLSQLLQLLLSTGEREVTAPVPPQAELEERQRAAGASMEAEQQAQRRQQAIDRGRNRAAALSQKGDLAGAIAILDMLIEQYPEDVEIQKDRQAAGLARQQRDAAQQRPKAPAPGNDPSGSPDIFISYAHADKAVAKRLAAALEAQGWSIFWDRRIPAGRRFSEFIAQKLAAAKCVVTLWSQAANDSDWVQEEAEKAKRRKILVPAFIERVDPPMGFGRIQAADLVDWNGEDGHEGFQYLLEDIGQYVPPTPVVREKGRGAS